MPFFSTLPATLATPFEVRSFRFFGGFFLIAIVLSIVELEIQRIVPYNVTMPKRSSKKKPSDDPNEAAKSVLDRVIAETEDEPTDDEPEKNPAAVALGRLGGKKGGPARAAKLTPEERREIAQKAARARWGEQKTPTEES